MRGFVLKFLRFIPVAMVTYGLVIAVLSNTTEPMLFNGQAFTNVPLNRPNGGLSVLRFREAEDYGDVDVLFLGSSHCYRTFDTQWLAGQGVRAFNLGSSAQGPLISYHLAPKYLEKLDPELVVLEVYSETLRSNSAESLLDQLANRPMEKSLFQMTVAAGGVKSWNGFLVHLLNFSDEPLVSRMPKQKAVNGHYVPGGFVRRELESGGLMAFNESLIPVNEKQLDYLDRLIAMVQAQGRKIVLVGQPLPKETLAAIADYDEIQAEVMRISDAYGVPFYDFNGPASPDGFEYLHDEDLFYDYHHLNMAGVAAFNPVFLGMLKGDGWL